MITAKPNGFCDIFEGGEIHIGVENREEMLCLSVYNSGTPMDAAMCEKINALNQLPLAAFRESFPDRERGYGVVNIMTRLRLKYGEEVRYYYEINENGTTGRIQIPGGGRKENGNV